MKLWELLFAGFFLQAFWFGWKWAYRALIVVVAAKVGGSIKQQALEKLKGDKPDGTDGSQAPV